MIIFPKPKISKPTISTKRLESAVRALVSATDLLQEFYDKGVDEGDGILSYQPQDFGVLGQSEGQVLCARIYIKQFLAELKDTKEQIQ